MRGLTTKLQTMMTTCQSATYYEAVNIANASEEKNKKHKEAKKKATSSSFFGRGQKRQNYLSSSEPRALPCTATFLWFFFFPTVPTWAVGLSKVYCRLCSTTPSECLSCSSFRSADP
jgi:hypothetical protein